MEKKEMARFKCIKCGMGGSYASRPVIGTCSKGGGHRWVSDENRTPKRWKCSKCGRLTSGVSHPLVSSCSKGGGHSWRKA